MKLLNGRKAIDIEDPAGQNSSPYRCGKLSHFFLSVYNLPDTYTGKVLKMYGYASKMYWCDIKNVLVLVLKMYGYRKKTDIQSYIPRACPFSGKMRLKVFSLLFIYILYKEKNGVHFWEKQCTNLGATVYIFGKTQCTFLGKRCTFLKKYSVQNT